MPAIRTYECEHCGEAFAALEDANAAETGYCSPACHEAGEDLA